MVPTPPPPPTSLCILPATRKVAATALALVLLHCLADVAFAVQVPGPNPYRSLPWAQLPEGRSFGPTSAIYADPDGHHIWVFDRCGSTFPENSCLNHPDVDPILRFDSEGNLVASFGAGLFIWPHGLHVDDEGNVWAVDGSRPGADATQAQAERGLGHKVVQFSPEGEVLLVLGTPGIPGDGPDHFRDPTDVAVARDGTIYVTEGHQDDFAGNDRVAVFAPDGTFLREFGGSGSGRGQLNGPHAIDIDSQGRLFVGDRGNNRIQIFDPSGELLAIWTQFGKPSGIYIDADDVIYVADSESATDHRNPNPGWERGIRIGDAGSGWVTHFLLWEDSSEDLTRPDPGPAGSGAEGVTADAEGNLYLGIVRTPEVRKYVRIRP